MDSVSNTPAPVGLQELTMCIIPNSLLSDINEHETRSINTTEMGQSYKSELKPSSPQRDRQLLNILRCTTDYPCSRIQTMLAKA